MMKAACGGQGRQGVASLMGLLDDRYKIFVFKIVLLLFTCLHFGYIFSRHRIQMNAVCIWKSGMFCMWLHSMVLIWLKGGVLCISSCMFYVCGINKKHGNYSLHWYNFHLLCIHSDKWMNLKQLSHTITHSSVSVLTKPSRDVRVGVSRGGGVYWSVATV